MFNLKKLEYNDDTLCESQTKMRGLFSLFNLGECLSPV